jgi:protein SCO1
MRAARRRERRFVLLVVGFVVALAAIAGITAASLSLSATQSGGQAPSSIGEEISRPVPTALLRAPFTDQDGRTLTLSQFAQKAVVLVPFLTSCQEECPVTTGALLDVKRALNARGLASKVAILEITVDPGRDVPERLAAYAKLTGASWPLLTAPPADLSAFWRYFGVYYQIVPEGSPPGIDWQTKRPYGYDVDHSDGFIVLDPHQRERFIAAGMARVSSLPPPFRELLDSQGRHDLTHPGGGSWTVSEALDSIASALRN